MKKLLLASALLLPAGALLASTALTPEREAEIRTTLTAQGYEVRKIEVEDGEIEVYALKNGARFELKLDDMMKVIETEGADDEKDDD